ncbi:MAG: hypothetical protein HQL87_05555 [Magnetococcales bacterium]|nr:hypothetical protein [Magnetococcales bacterium]
MSWKVTVDDLTYGYQWDETGRGRDLTWKEATVWQPGPGSGTLFLVCNSTLPEVRLWLRQDSGIDFATVNIMLNDDDRPRLVRGPEGTLVILRGMNDDSKSSDTPMIPIKIWVDKNRVIALRGARVLAFRDVLADLRELGEIPSSTVDLLHHIISKVIFRMESLVTTLISDLDQLESRILSTRTNMPMLRSFHSEVVRLRKRVITVRSHLVPMGALASAFLRQRGKWMETRQRRLIAEEFERLHDYLEALGMVRERSSLLEDEIHAMEASQMDRNIYVLTFLTGVFVPMNLIPSMLGSNIGGIYGATDPDAFEYLIFVELLIFAVGLFFFMRHVRKLSVTS